MAIKNIIFDLGGVLLNINFDKTTEAFNNLGVKNFDNFYTQYYSNPLFKQLETGAIVNTGFYDELRNTAAINSDNDTIDAAWNAMLLDFPHQRIDTLKKLSTQYRLFLFSNTNAIHHAAFHKKFRDEFGFNFDSLFEKAWYSHLIGYRKPDIASFEFVINDGNIKAEETIFIDDTLPNVEAAVQAGLKGVHLSREKDVITLLNEIL